MPESASVPYHDIPGNKLQSKGMVNWSRLDVFVLFASIGISFAVGVWTHWALGITVALFLLPLSIRTNKSMGRIYFILGKGIYGSLIIDLILKGRLWLNDDPSGKFVQFFRYKKYHRHPPSVIPLQLGRVQAVIDGKKERFSLIHQLDRPYDHLYLAARGGAFASLDIARNHRAVSELARLTNNVITQSPLKVGISYLRIKGPFDPTKTARYFRSNMNPYVAEPDNFILDQKQRSFAEWLRENSNQLGPVSRAFGAAESWYVIVITIKRTRELNNARRGRSSNEQIYDLPIIELGRSMMEELQQSSLLELKDIRCLGLAELSSMVRCSWDVTGIQKYYTDRASGLIPENDDQIDDILAQFDDIEEGYRYINDILQAFPDESVEAVKKGNYLKLNDNHISTLRVTALPSQVRADQFLALHNLLGPGQWSRMAMVGESVSGNMETQQLIVNQSALISLNTAFKSNRVVQSPRFRRKQRQLTQQVEQMSANSVSQHFNMLITVVASSYPELKRVRQKVVATSRANNFSIEEVEGSAFLLDTSISGLFGINRL